MMHITPDFIYAMIDTCFLKAIIRKLDLILKTDRLVRQVIQRADVLWSGSRMPIPLVLSGNSPDGLMDTGGKP